MKPLIPLSTPNSVFAVLPCIVLPRRDRAFVQSKGDHNGLQRAAVRQEREHEHDEIPVRAHAVERRVFRFAESLMALMTKVTPFVPTLDPDVATTDFPFAGQEHRKYRTTLRVAPPSVPLCTRLSPAPVMPGAG